MASELAVVVAILGAVGAAALYAFKRLRAALAASLVGEIAEALNVIEMHDIERILGQASEGSSASVALPAFSAIAYRSQVNRLGLLGSHLARLTAAFYESLSVLGEELHALAAETSETERIERKKLIMTELQQTFALGDDVLQGLRSLISRHDASISRA